MLRWISFFFGSLRRAATTGSVIAIVAIIEHYAPGAVATYVAPALVWLAGLGVQALGPVVAMLLPFIIVAFGLRMIWRGVGGGGASKKRRR